RRVSDGVITTVAGGGSLRDDGPATSARLIPWGVAVDAAGNLYIADGAAKRICKVSGGVITTVAGNGTYGYRGDNGPATSAQLFNPSAVAVASAAGYLYIVDGPGNLIRKVSGGVITNMAGTWPGGFSGDNGPATSALFRGIRSLAVDYAGNLYI